MLVLKPNMKVSPWQTQQYCLANNRSCLCVYGCSDEKLITLLMDMKSQLDTVTHQQQLILQEMVKKTRKEHATVTCWNNASTPDIWPGAVTGAEAIKFSNGQAWTGKSLSFVRLSVSFLVIIFVNCYKLWENSIYACLHLLHWLRSCMSEILLLVTRSGNIWQDRRRMRNTIY